MSELFPGMNKSVRLDHFDQDEQKIVELLAQDWYITNGGNSFNLNQTSNYKFCLIKPTRAFKEMFNIEREVAVVFSPYSDFEPRSVVAIDYVFDYYPDLRLENVCCILISKDKNIQSKISNLLKGDPESRVIIPFSYEDFFYAANTYFIKNRFRNFFFERDLFAFESPITKDFFFFGRSKLIQKLINRHKTKENSGLFGLRKTGKTSVVNGVHRALKVDGIPSVVIDCQDTAFNQKRWFKALLFLMKEIKKQNNIQSQLEPDDKYNEEQASESFEKDIKRVYKKLRQQPILFIFDEIENISPVTSPNEFWKTGLDFVLFWQTLRSKFQKFLREEETSIFTFLIVGTNPKAIETPRIQTTDNPIFNKVPFEFIKGFNVDQTKEMVSKLGGYMGLEFDDVVYSKLNEDFGGHPYLIRHVCSIANEEATSNRPVKIDKVKYQEAKRLFGERYSHYFDMILQVLIEFYPEEYDMLTYLALDDIESFLDLANLSAELIAHLKGYGVIDENDGTYYFKIESIKQYLISKNQYKNKLKSPEERWKEISERRNKLESNLRQVVRMQLQSHFGKSDAFQKVIDIFGDPRKSKSQGKEYSDLFDPNKTEIYFSDLTKLIQKYYQEASFSNIFGTNKSETVACMEVINKYRTDAHAKNIDSSEMEFFRVHIGKIENLVNEFI